MATKIFISKGNVSCVYDDRFMPLLEALGSLTVRRASQVEFDSETHEWAAFCENGKEIARGRNRNDVIAAEVAWLEGDTK